MRHSPPTRHPRGVPGDPVPGRAGDRVQSTTGGLVVPYAPDYRDSGADEAMLRAIAAAGGGALLTRPAQAFADNAPPVDDTQRVPAPLQVPLLLLALLLLPIDVAARRLVLSRDDLRAFLPSFARGRAATRSDGIVAPVSAPLARMRARRVVRVAPSSPSQDTPATSPTGNGALERRMPAQPPAAQPPAVAEPGALGSIVARRPAATQALPAVPAKPTGAAVAPTAEGEPGALGADGSSTSRLLDAKRRRRG